MSRICQECGKFPVFGIKYKRRGKAKAKGGVGRKIVGKTRRQFFPNLQNLKVVLPGGTHETIRLCTACLRTLTRKGRLPKLGEVRKAASRKHVFAGE